MIEIKLKNGSANIPDKHEKHLNEIIDSLKDKGVSDYKKKTIVTGFENVTFEEFRHTMHIARMISGDKKAMAIYGIPKMRRS